MNELTASQRRRLWRLFKKNLFNQDFVEDVMWNWPDDDRNSPEAYAYAKKAAKAVKEAIKKMEMP